MKIVNCGQGLKREALLRKHWLSPQNVDFAQVVIARGNTVSLTPCATHGLRPGYHFEIHNWHTRPLSLPNLS